MQDVPQYGEWEVAVVEVPGLTIRNVTLQGVLLVVDRFDGRVFGAEPLEMSADPSGTLLTLVLEPMAAVPPHRPLVIWCRREQLASFASAAMTLGAQLRAASELPMLDEAAEAFGNRLAPLGVLPSDPRPWVPRLRTWMDEAPWRLLSDQTLFIVVAGPEALAGRAAVVLGQAGEQRGLVLYPSPAHQDRFLDALDTATDPIRSFSGLCMHLDFTDDVEPEIVERLAKVDLVYGDTALVCLAVEAGEARVLTDDEQALLRAMADAVIEVVRRVGPAAETERHVEQAIHTEAGSLSILVRPGSPPRRPIADLIGDKSFRLLVGWGDRENPLPEIVVKMTKRDAQALNRRIEGIDEISVAEEDEGKFMLLAWEEGELLGRLCFCPADTHDIWDRILAHGEARLVIAGGGSTRLTMRQQDVVAVHRVLLDIDDDIPVDLDDPA